MLSKFNPDLINCVLNYLKFEYWDYIADTFYPKFTLFRHILYNYPRKHFTLDSSNFDFILKFKNINAIVNLTIILHKLNNEVNNSLQSLLNKFKILRQLIICFVGYMNHTAITSVTMLNIFLPQNCNTLEKIISDNLNILGVNEFKKLHTYDVTHTHDDYISHQKSLWKVIITTKNKTNIKSTPLFDKKIYSIGVVQVKIEEFGKLVNKLPKHMKNANCFYFSNEK
jgi:hypothetical protein